MWKKGKIEVNGKAFWYWAKVFDKGSIFGIDEGRISKLEIRLDDETVANYDRGWDIRPTDADAEKAYEKILELYK